MDPDPNPQHWCKSAGVCIFVKFSLVWTLNILYRGSGEDLVCENANKYHLEIHLGLACGENKFIEVGK